ncbi:MAG: bifunctional oligoribonuclease/PAP phosphatase NrnA [Bacillota bacterium]
MSGIVCQVAAVLRACSSAVIVTHALPDGDAVGSSLGLALALERLGINVVFAGSGPLPEQYHFLPGQHLYVAGSGTHRVELVIYVDCASPDRVDGVRVEGDRVVNIDHHITNDGFGDVAFVDPSAPAAGEQVYRLLEPLGVALDEAIATCLYTALVSDTGWFTHENTTPGACRIAARLLEAGVRPDQVAWQLQGNRPLSALRLLGRALSSLEVREDGKLAVMQLGSEDLLECGALAEETDGIVNYGISLSGVELAVLLKEMPKGGVRASLRSRGRVDVAQLAAALGGGGHARAAGCTLSGPLESARETLVAAAAERVQSL